MTSCVSHLTRPGSDGVRAFASVTVLVFVVAVSLLTLATLGSTRVAWRRELVLVREEEVRVAAGFALAAAENQARRELAGESTSGNPEITLPRDGAAAPPDPGTAPRRVEGGELWVQASRRPVSDGGETWHVVRDPSTGSITRRSMPSLALHCATTEELRDALLPDGVSPPQIAALQDLAVALLAAQRGLQDADDLRAFVENFASAPGALPGIDLDRLLADIDPVARLRRTNVHPTRTEGMDRGRVIGSRPSIHAGPALRQELSVEVRSTGRESRTWRAAEGRRIAHRLALRVQNDWLEPQLDQPGGVVVGAAFGPELLTDREWEPGTSHYIATPGVDPTRLDARPVAQGLSLFGDSMRARLDIVAGTLRFTELPDVSATHGPPTMDVIQWVGPRLLVGAQQPARVGFAQHQVYLEGSPASACSRFPVLVRAVCPVGGRAIVWLSDDSLALLDSRGSVLRVRGDFACDGAPIFLPLLDRWAFSSPAAGGWLLVDGELQARLVSGSGVTGRVESIVGDGVDGFFWVGQSSEQGPSWLGHTRFHGDTVVPSPGPSLDQRPVALCSFPARALAATWAQDGRYELWRVGAVALVRAGEGQVPEFRGGVVPDVGRMAFWLPSSSGVLLHHLVPRSPKELDLGAQLVLNPRAMGHVPGFRAPLVGGFDAELDDGAGGRMRVEPAGTMNLGSSALRAPDLSDLLVDGAYSSPRRGETLRYSTLASGDGTGDGVASSTPSLAEGWAEVLVKPERSAADSPEPHRPRILLRFVQHAALSFTPDSQWISQHHPSHPSPASIRAYQVIGGSQRELRITSDIVRAPAAQVWRHERSAVVIGVPWELRVWVGDPTVELPPLIVDQICPGGILESTSVVTDASESGVWTRLVWAWQAGGRAYLQLVGQDGAWASSGSPSEWSGSAFETLPRGWVLELGGVIDGEKAFKGTLQQLSIGRDASPSASPSRPLMPDPDRPGWRWVLPFEVEPGGRLLRVAALGDFSSGTDLEWRIDEWTALGLRSWFARGRQAAVPESPARSARYVVSGWLIPDESRRYTPLVEALEVTWLGAPEPWSLSPGFAPRDPP